MAKKEVKTEEKCSCKSCPKGVYVLKGIIAIILGLVLILGYLNLAQVAAIVLILVGLKKIIWCGT